MEELSQNQRLFVSEAAEAFQQLHLLGLQLLAAVTAGTVAST